MQALGYTSRLLPCRTTEPAGSSLSSPLLRRLVMARRSRLRNLILYVVVPKRMSQQQLNGLRCLLNYSGVPTNRPRRSVLRTVVCPEYQKQWLLLRSPVKTTPGMRAHYHAKAQSVVPLGFVASFGPSDASVFSDDAPKPNRQPTTRTSPVSNPASRVYGSSQYQLSTRS